MNDLIKRDDALNACALREDNPPTEMQLSLRNVISALPAIDPTNRIEQTESKLTKTMEALRDTTQMLSQCQFTDMRHKVVNKANAVLAELEKK